jgi:hypothetical protein
MSQRGVVYARVQLFVLISTAYVSLPGEADMVVYSPKTP